MEEVVEVEARDLILMTAYECEIQAQCEVLRRDEGRLAAAAQFVPASGPLRVLRQATGVLEVEVFVVQLAVTACLHFS